MDRRIGAQCYTVREYMQTIEDFDKACAKLAETGYKVLQISGTPLGAKEMREVLDKYSLEVFTTHRSWADFQKNPDEVIEYNKILGSRLCGLGMMPVDCAADETSLTAFIKETDKICDMLKNENMYFGYHNHAFEFAKVGNRTILEWLIEETNPEVFRFIVDTYWVQLGGKDPSKIIRSLGKRAMAVHFKDYMIDKSDWLAPKFADIGVGNLDWDEIIAACDEAGTECAFVEYDNSPSPFDSLAASYKYLLTKGFN